jgi:UDP-N-acetylmuramoyl-tripeptide--D-alanyl-D-alanine ligase
MKLTLGQIADWIHAEGDFHNTAEALGYSIDSRTMSAGDLFFAVKGERVDGHDYVELALRDGAIAAVVSMRWLRPETVDESRLLRVPDDEADCVLQSMQRLANRVRRLWGKRLIGITGSAGKTTTKECVAAVLGSAMKVLKTEGNLNNHFGVPLQLLRLEPEHDIAVLEMGMNHAGEIRALAKIAEPNWAVVSNVAPVHLEFFADGLDGIARAKYELVESLPADGVAILNSDDDRVRVFGNGLAERAIYYGTDERASIRALDLNDLGLHGTEFTVAIGDERYPIALRLPGRHNVLNALAAIAVAHASGIDLPAAISALEALRPTEKRGNVFNWRGAHLVNDTYNANPRALDAMVEALRHTPAQRRIVVAGEMLELGPAAAELHAASGRAMQGIDLVLGVRGLAAELVAGAFAAGVRATFVETPAEAGAWLRAHLQPGDMVLLKASRGVRLERVLDALPEP